MKPLDLSDTRRAEPADSTLPLINVVFLLLIFVMLSGVIRAADPLPLDPAQSAAGEQEREADEARTIYVAADGALRFRETTALDAIAAEAATLMTAQDWPTLYLKADRAVPANRVLEIVKALRAAGVPSLTMIVERSE